MNRFENIDCMIGMKEYEDNHFDLAIVDPPYGIGGGSNVTLKRYDDAKPNKDYFIELIRISKNQIIWGGNYFSSLIPFNSTHTIIWDKENGDSFMSDAEIAFTSFDKNTTKIYKQFWMSNMMSPLEKPIVHLNQKPKRLYKWLLTKYAKEGDLILDTHVGSASSLIACEDMGFNYVGFELDEDYYKAAQKRLEQFRSQPKFDLPIVKTYEQEKLAI